MRAMPLAALLTGLALGACSPAPSPSPPTTSLPSIGLSVSNDTPLTVTVVVNGTPVGTVGPQAGSQVPASAPLPWSVAVTTASGRVLTTMQVSVSDATQSDPNVHTIPMGRIDLSCGRLTVWAGDYPPSGPIPPSPAGHPGDCAP